MAQLDTYLTMDEAVHASLEYFNKEDGLEDCGTLSVKLNHPECKTGTKTVASIENIETGTFYVCFILKDNHNG